MTGRSRRCFREIRKGDRAQGLTARLFGDGEVVRARMMHAARSAASRAHHAVYQMSILRPGIV